MTRPALLTRDTVVDGALAVLSAGRPLSMRNLAEQLGCSTMAAYRHVPDRDTLGALCIDRVLEPAELDIESFGALVLLAAERLQPYGSLADDFAAAVHRDPLLPATARWVAAVRQGEYGSAELEVATWLVPGGARRSPALAGEVAALVDREWSA